MIIIIIVVVVDDDDNDDAFDHVVCNSIALLIIMRFMKPTSNLKCSGSNGIYLVQG